MQTDLDRLEHKVVVNRLKFNKNKCHILLLGWSNFGHRNKLGEEWLESSLGGRSLGVLVCSRLGVSQQSALEVLRANAILGCLEQSNQQVK